MGQEIIIDLTNYKDRVGAHVDPGRYLVEVEDAEPDRSKAGNQMVNLWFRVLEGPFQGATIVDRLTNTEKALFRIVGFLQALGYPTPKKRIKLDIAKWLGRKLYIDVDDGEPYNGRVKSEVRGYLRLDAANASANGNGDGTAPADLPTGEDGLDTFAQKGDGAEDTPEDTPAAEPEVADVPEAEVPTTEATDAAAAIDAVEAPQQIDLDAIDLG